MKITNIALITIFLFILLLCLKITLVEYFSIDTDITNLGKRFNLKIDIQKFNNVCKDKLDALQNDTTSIEFMRSLTSTENLSLSFLTNLDMPSGVKECIECIIENDIIDTNGYESMIEHMIL
jgi:hypothetical protein